MASSSSELAAKAEGSGGGSGEGSDAAAAAVVAGAGIGISSYQQQQQMLFYRELKKGKKDVRGCTAKERISKMPPCAAGKRSSIYRGVTRHRWTGRYEAHLWDKSSWNQNQNKKGKQVYLGAYDDEEAAARAYDLAALKYWGPGTLINFPVTDYARDLEEMQNISREDYLASLRRKSSGFSRGASKYRGLSSRWDSSFGRTTGTDYFNSIHYGAEATTESDYLSSVCVDRKIDLTSYIQWWGSNRTRSVETHTKSSEETQKRGGHEDIGSELKALEWANQLTEPYQMPCLGVSLEGRRRGTRVSAMSILSRSASFKSLREKVSKRKEISIENDENENKNTINKMDYGKAVEKSSSHDDGSESLGIALAMNGAVPFQRNVCPLTHFLSAPLLTSYNNVDPLLDPILWTSLVPVLPTGSSRAAEVVETETTSDYTFFQQED